jgi:DNA invertase Pin-like site-specific DNA recombinase
MKSEEPTKKLGYARVSTSDQNLDMQIAALMRYGVPEELIFTDKLSGGSSRRPGFIQALQLAQIPGTEFVVWKLDRLGRTLSGILAVMELLQKRGVAFVSLTERLDTSGAMGKAMLRLMAIFAELERDLIRERTMAGLRRAKERGDPHGRPRGMTDERIKRAQELMEEGRRGNDAWKELRKIPGPGLSRSVFYVWQRAYDIETADLELETES